MVEKTHDMHRNRRKQNASGFAYGAVWLQGDVHTAEAAARVIASDCPGGSGNLQS
jgi:hypothetical protein